MIRQAGERGHEGQGTAEDKEVAWNVSSCAQELIQQLGARQDAWERLTLQNLTSGISIILWGWY